MRSLPAVGAALVVALLAGCGGGGPTPAGTPAVTLTLVASNLAFDQTQLTNGGGASMPSFSPDGNWVYYIHDTPTRGKWPRRGTPTWYDIDLNELFRVKADGSGQPQRLLSGQVRSGSNRWSAWIRQPTVSPDGKTVALVTDAPDPDNSNVVLQFFDLAP